MKRKIFVLLAFISLVTYSAAQELKIKELTNYYSGNWIVAGIIENTSEKTYQYVELGLTCFDSGKKIVHTDSTYAFAPITPGSEIPFSFITSPEDARGISSFTVSIDDFSIGGKGTFNYSISKLTITEKNSTYVKYVGQITNNNSELKKYVEIALLGFDESGKLIYFDTTYPSKSSLPSGGVSNFDFLVPPERSGKIKTVKCIAYSD